MCARRAIWKSRLQLTESVLDCTVSHPTLEEQTAIVRFLDHADRRIRRYLRAKEKLIAVLEEQKQAIIQQAVTGQIDVRTGRPYPSYQDSGVEWLGEVPEHWEVCRSKTSIFSMPYGGRCWTQNESWATTCSHISDHTDVQAMTVGPNPSKTLPSTTDDSAF